jgi:hypothetical protein
MTVQSGAVVRRAELATAGLIAQQVVADPHSLAVAIGEGIFTSLVAGFSVWSAARASGDERAALKWKRHAMRNIPWPEVAAAAGNARASFDLKRWLRMKLHWPELEAAKLDGEVRKRRDRTPNRSEAGQEMLARRSDDAARLRIAIQTAAEFRVQMADRIRDIGILYMNKGGEEEVQRELRLRAAMLTDNPRIPKEVRREIDRILHSQSQFVPSE